MAGHAPDRLDQFGLKHIGHGPLAQSARRAEHHHVVGPIKTVLCDQRLIGGLGNAYADEILWEARIKPRRTASLMTAEEIARVHAATATTLAAATAALRQLVGAGPLRGEPKREFFRVHHRARKPCPRCGARILTESLRGRSTYWCPGCQR